MSTDGNNPGGKMAAAEILEDSKRIVTQARQREQQLSLLDKPTPEEMQRAQDELGPGAGSLAVLEEARRGRGRPKNSKNRRTKDFREYLLKFGRHPALTLMEIQSTAPEVLVERSRALDPVKKQLDYGAAQSLIVRCAEALMPYMESKMPVAVELGVEGDFNLLIPGVNVPVDDATAAAAGSFVPYGEFIDVGDEEEGA